MLAVASKLQAATCVAPTSADTLRPVRSSSSRPSGTENACYPILRPRPCFRAASAAASP